MATMTSEIGSLYGELCSLLNELHNNIKAQPEEDESYAQFQELSFAGKTDSGLFIPPRVQKQYFGKDAVSYSADACRIHLRMPDQPSLSVYRAVGISPCTGQTLSIIDEVNGIKSLLKAKLTQCDRGERKRIIQTIALGAVLIQIYRHISYVDFEVSCIKPTWTVSGFSSFTSTSSNLIRHLKEIQAGRLSAGQSAAFIEDDIDRLKQYPEQHAFKVIRPSRPFVRYKVQSVDGSWRTFPAHLPLFINRPLSTVDYTPLAESPPLPQAQKGNKQWLIRWLGVAA